MVVGVKRLNWRSGLLVSITTLSTLFILYYSSQYQNELSYQEQTSIYFSPKDESEPANGEKTKKPKLLDDPIIQFLQYEMIEEDTRNVDLHSTIYDQIFTNHKTGSIMGNLNFDQRCQLFFNNLYVQNSNWFLNPNEKMEPDYSGSQYQNYKRKYFKSFKSQFDKKKPKPAPKEYDKALELFIRHRFRYFKNIEDDEFPQKVQEYFTALRIFNKCYVTNDEPNQKKQMDNFIKNQKSILGDQEISPFEYTEKEKLSASNIHPSSFEHRVYPWLTFEYPVYEHWTGSMLHEIPDMKSHTVKPYSKTKGKSGFLKEFKNNANGKGIVITLADEHIDSVVSMINLLRALKNKLPIQIINFDELKRETKQKIVAAARNDIETLPLSYMKVQELLGKDYFDHSAGGLPKQEIWFVSIHNAIDKNYRDNFNKFGNKFLAALFNSFEEFMLVDVDVAMLKPPEYFFNMKKYKETGTLLFRDRALGATNKRDFFKKIGPSIIDFAMFNIPIMTDYTLDREFFKGTYNYIESGLVMMNRNLHFNSLLLTVQTYFFPIIKGKVHGDKELFWLGMALNGDENYHINGIAAAAVGQLTNPKERLREDGTELYSQEVCSAHPAHISDEDGHTLLWLNSGLSVCHGSSKVNYEKEAKLNWKFKYLSQTPQAFKEFFESPLIIEHAIVPAFDGNVHKNIEEEPEHGWQMGSYCNKYMWCAFSRIGGKTKDGRDNHIEGKIITFEKQETDLFKYYADTYMGLE